MHPKLYEVFLSLYQLHQGRGEAVSKDAEAFMRAGHGVSFDEKLCRDIAARMAAASGMDAESVYLRCARLMEYMDYGELRLLCLWLDRFLKEHPRPRYDALKLVLHAAHVLATGSTLHITQRSYPHLFLVFGHQEDFGKTMARLYILRNQLSDMMHKEKAMPLPLWEMIVQLTVLHCAYFHIKDEDDAVYSIVVRFARRQLALLSFQQVMRLCGNLRTLSAANPGVHLLFLEQVEKQLDSTSRAALVVALMEMRAGAGASAGGPELAYFLESVLTACRFSPDDLGRLIFGLPHREPGLPAHFKVHPVPEEGLELALREGLLAPVPRGAGSLIVARNDAKTLRLGVKRADKTEDRDMAENSEQVVEGHGLLFKPSRGEVCCFPITSSALLIAGVSLTFHGNRILNDITFAAKTGELVAVIGPSGCGKSTMLTMLSGILDYTQGDVFFNHRRLSSVEDFSAVSTYIPQDDILFRELTVRESIEYSVRLKVKSTPEEREKRRRATIEVLGLERTEFLKIGAEGEKGISGGQRKRVNIGTTIVADMKPILLFDEPTSGLDPATDLEIMQLLRVLSRRGHIVLCVTHNVSDDSINYFDKIMVLAKSGQIAFFGKKQRLPYFFSIGGPQYLFQKMAEPGAANYREKYLASPECAGVERTKQKALDLARGKIELAHAKAPSPSHKQLPGPVSNFANFVRREIRRKTRDRQFLMTCLVQPVVIAAFIAWNFPGPLPNALFSLLVAVLWIGSISGVREINGEFPQLKRDYLYGTSLAAYFAAKITSCFAFSSFQVVLLASLVMLGGGYLGEPFGFSYPGIIGVLLLLTLMGTGIGLFMSGAVKSPLAAVGVLPIILIPLVIMGGALIPHHHTDGLQDVVMRGNPLRIAFEGSAYSARNLLRPQLDRVEPRKPEDAEKQAASWAAYKEKLHLYDHDRTAYRKQYVQADVNDIFASLLAGNPEGGETPRPSPPVDVIAPEILEHRRDLWLAGYLLLPVDRTTGFLAASAPAFWQPYPVTAPKAFSENLSAQGALGMYREERPQSGEKRAFSYYSPAQLSLVMLGELLLLSLATYFIVRHKLAQKFS